MYILQKEDVQKIAQVNNFLNSMQVSGGTNIDLMYNSMVILQGVLKNLQAQTQDVVLDNTKEKEDE